MQVRAVTRVQMGFPQVLPRIRLERVRQLRTSQRTRETVRMTTSLSPDRSNPARGWNCHGNPGRLQTARLAAGT